MNESIESLEPFDPRSYESIDLNRLVVYTIIELENRSIDLSLENIVIGAFKLFPKRFSLEGYPEFPDATRVEKSLWRCKGKAKQWIGGKTPHGYLVTDKTRAIAKQTAEELAAPGLRKRRAPSKMRRKESLIKDVTGSPAYRKYVSGEEELVSEADLCYSLQGTLDSPRETIRTNLVSLRGYADDLDRADVLQFLTWLEKRFSDFLNGTR